MKIAIFDIDNCVADDSRRLGRIDWTNQSPDLRYEAYHADCGSDPLINADVLAHAAGVVDRIVFSTSRPVAYRAVTEAWLEAAFEKIGVAPPHGHSVLMRDSGDVRSSLELKRAHLSRLSGYSVSVPEDIPLAFDDRSDIVDMYKMIGISGARLLRGGHDESVYKPDAGADRLRAGQILRAAAQTFELRNSEYADAYKRVGGVLAALFPDGLQRVGTPQEFARLHAFMMCVGKLHRYAANLGGGGHQDSARDLQVYAAMLEELTDERPRN